MSLVKAFDKKAAFGEVFGAPGVAYDQNGQFYNYDYEPVDLQGNILKVTAPVVAPKAKTVVPAPVDEKLEVAEDEDTPEDEKPIDFQAWARGELPHIPFLKIKAEIARAYQCTPPQNKQEALKIVLGA